MMSTLFLRGMSQIQLTKVAQIQLTKVAHFRVALTPPGWDTSLAMAALEMALRERKPQPGWDTSLAMAALEMALRERKPQPGCIHHSDRGVQCASAEHVQTLKDHGFGISMSRKGNPYDNALVENFFKTLKQEEVYLTEYPTMHDVRDRLPRFIEGVYNRKRLHSSLGYLPPREFEFIWNLEHKTCREGCTLLAQSVQS